MSKPNTPLNYNAAMILLSLVLAWVGWFGIKQDFGKHKFTKVTGVVSYISHHYNRYPNRDPEKYRYIGITNYNKIFEVFIGKEWGDFEPAYEKIDRLRLGDTITVYHDDQGMAEDLNRLAYYIDRGSETIFVQGKSKQRLEFLMEGFILLLMLLITWLKRTGRIF